MNSTQTVDLHDVDAYFKSRNLVDDKHRPYCLRWLQRYLSGPWETLQGTSLSSAYFAEKNLSQWFNSASIGCQSMILMVSGDVFLTHCKATGCCLT
jgi:hypothetical protein